MGARELKHAAMRREWEGKVAECRSSGINVKTWCEEQGIDRRTYYRWEKEILARGGQQQMAVVGSVAGSRFVEVPALLEGASGADYGPGLAAKLRMRGGELEIYAGADSTVVETLLRALKDAE